MEGVSLKEKMFTKLKADINFMTLCGEMDDSGGEMSKKAKVTSLKTKPLPTLGLLAVYLALKCVPTVLRGCGGFSPTQIQVATDS